jgi:hypothetical protein
MDDGDESDQNESPATDDSDSNDSSGKTGQTAIKSELLSDEHFQIENKDSDTSVQSMDALFSLFSSLEPEL